MGWSGGGSYPSEEKQLVNSTALTDWARVLGSVKYSFIVIATWSTDMEQ